MERWTELQIDFSCYITVQDKLLWDNITCIAKNRPRPKKQQPAMGVLRPDWSVITWNPTIPLTRMRWTHVLGSFPCLSEGHKSVVTIY